MSLSKRNPIDHLYIKVACINTVRLCNSSCNENVPTCTPAVNKYHGLGSCLVNYLFSTADSFCLHFFHYSDF